KLGTPVLVSDIPANREMQLDEESYFAVGDTDTLCVRLREFASATPETRARNAKRLNGLCQRFDWDTIAASTMSVMERAAGRPTRVPWPAVAGGYETRAPAVAGSSVAQGLSQSGAEPMRSAPGPRGSPPRSGARSMT
ncbi:MAG TPA: hypothetical protein VGL87_10070, partial [Steroidobacteraceae bacterium]